MCAISGSVPGFPKGTLVVKKSRDSSAHRATGSPCFTPWASMKSAARAEGCQWLSNLIIKSKLMAQGRQISQRQLALTCVLEDECRAVLAGNNVLPSLQSYTPLLAMLIVDGLQPGEEVCLDGGQCTEVGPRDTLISSSAQNGTHVQKGPSPHSPNRPQGGWTGMCAGRSPREQLRPSPRSPSDILAPAPQIKTVISASCILVRRKKNIA